MGGALIPCVFETMYRTEFGARVALLGDVPELGAWSPSKALYASDVDGKKIVKVDLPSGLTTFFKWSLVDSEPLNHRRTEDQLQDIIWQFPSDCELNSRDGNIVRWEDTPNKRLTVPDCDQMRIVAPWNEAPTIKFVTSSVNQLLTPGMAEEGLSAAKPPKSQRLLPVKFKLGKKISSTTNNAADNTFTIVSIGISVAFLTGAAIFMYRNL